MKWTPALFALIVAVGPASSPAEAPSRKYGDLLKRLPEQANTLVLIDVDGLLDSPLGRREKWREAAVSRPTGILGVSGDVSKIAIAAGVDLTTSEETWKVGMIQTHSIPPPIATLAAREGGYVEQVETHNVAWTPRNFYLLSFPENILGFAVPSDRQRLDGWLRSTFIRPRTYPPGWADRAIVRADKGVPIILAVNLENAIGGKGADAWLRTLPAKTITINKMNFDLLAPMLASAKSALLQVDVRETITGTIRIEFSKDVDHLNIIAKDVVLSAFADYSIDFDELRSWSCVTEGNAITLSSRLSEAPVRRFLSFASAPTLAPSREDEATAMPPNVARAASAPAPDPMKPAGEPTPEMILKATKGYYASVVETIEMLKSQEGSKRNNKVWYERAARQIEGLPLLFVDNDLLDWGGKVALSLREMAYGINYANKDTVHRISGSANAYYGYGYNTGSRAVGAEVVKKQTGAVLDVALNGTWQGLETSIAEMRRKLVTKYKVSF